MEEWTEYIKLIFIAVTLFLVVILCFKTFQPLEADSTVTPFDAVRFLFDNCIIEGSANLTMNTGDYYVTKFNNTLCVIQYEPRIPVE